MAFTTISTASIAPGKPITSELLNAYRDRDEFLNGAVGTLEAQNILNGSFEIDSDGDGVPDSWTLALYTGGTYAIDTSINFHGSKSLRFVHPGGAGNGGGNAVSEFFPVSTGQEYVVSWALRSTAPTLNKVIVLAYDNNESTVDAGSTLYTDTATAAAFSATHSTYTPPAGARFVKVQVVGGSTNNSTAGSVYFDDVRVAKQPSFGTINQNLLKTATASISGLSTVPVSINLNDYAFFPKIQGNGSTRILYNATAINATADNFVLGLSTGTANYSITYRYITASEGKRGAIFKKNNRAVGGYWFEDAPNDYLKIFQNMAQNNGWSYTTESNYEVYKSIIDNL